MQCETSCGWGNHKAAGHWRWVDRVMHGYPALTVFQSIHSKALALIPKYVCQSLKSFSFWGSITAMQNILNNHFPLTLAWNIWYSKSSLKTTLNFFVISGDETVKNLLLWDFCMPDKPMKWLSLWSFFLNLLSSQEEAEISASVFLHQEGTKWFLFPCVPMRALLYEHRLATKKLVFLIWCIKWSCPLFLSPLPLAVRRCVLYFSYVEFQAEKLLAWP